MPLRIVVILAGGGGRRMGGVDKGEVVLGGCRLIDHVAGRLAPQADRLLISGAHHYGSGLTVIADRDDGPRGPAAGLWAIAHWIRDNMPEQKFFVTAPIDGPFVPVNLVDRLLEVGGTAYARDDNGVHPTFSCWEVAPLLKLLETHTGKGIALQEIARDCNGTEISFPGGRSLMNINTAEELVCAQALINQGN